jgi:hypothetical protein
MNGALWRPGMGWQSFGGVSNPMIGAVKLREHGAPIVCQDLVWWQLLSVG